MRFSVIELCRLQKVVGGNTVLDVESLAVGAGQVVAILEPAGTGIAALLALLTGQVRPTAGTVRVGGLDPARDRERLSRLIGVLLAENSLYERLSARANLAFHCRLRGLPARQADEVLSQVGLADHASVAAGRLTPALARRLALGRAILHDPPVLVLVEPFAHCDSTTRSLLAQVISQCSQAGTSVLILAGEAVGLSRLSPTVYELREGRLVAGDPGRTGLRAELPIRVPVRLEDKVALLNPADILYASAAGDHACLHTTGGQITAHLTLAELEARLARSGFFRAHRAYLVNLQRVKEVIPYTRDSFTLILDDAPGTEIPLSKTAARELRGLLGY